MEHLTNAVARLIRRLGLDDNFIAPAATAAAVIAMLLISFLAAKLFRAAVIPALQAISIQTKTKWDDHLLNDKVLHAVGRLIPPVIWYLLLPVIFIDAPVLLAILLKGCLIYLTVASLLLVNTLLNTFQDISVSHKALRDRPLKGVYQMVNLVAACVGAIIVVSILIDKDATAILTGLGASAAVLMLVFRDTILGLVAGVQLSANDMLRPGDWITMEKYGADGYVTEVTLTTVKIQNFDKTVTTIPPYALVSDSFRNWRGMRESGGRRIKRSLAIDVNTVRVCSAAETEALRAAGLAEDMDIACGTTNLALFRAHAARYLRNHPDVHPELMQMVRMLQPTPEGLPVEIYCFSKKTDWVPYEAVQNEIFDHLIAAVPRFGLRIFQRPAGTDLPHSCDMPQP